MSVALDPPYGSRDASDMAGRVRAIPEQILAALADQAPWRPPSAAPDLLAVGALGGSAIAADLTASLWSDRLPQPLIVVRGYHWPACVGRGSLALLASYSGNTEETLALYDEAGARGVPRLALTTGGALAERCARDGVAWLDLPPGSPPRAAMYASWVRVTRLLAALGWIDDPDPAWREAAQVLAARGAALAPESPEARNPAKRLARALHGKRVFLYASDRLGPLVTRVRNQLNENAKLHAHSAVVPELNHNEVVGWEREVARDSALVVVRDRDDEADVTLRLALTAEYVRERGADVHEIEVEEGSRLVRCAALAQLGDWLSVYLALLSGVDPTPIVSIDRFKSKLAESRSAP